MPPHSLPQNRKRILIVDDAQSVRESLGWLIENEPGLTVVGSASNGLDALRLANDLTPDLVILDIELPDMDGFAVARGLKAMPNPPFVVLLSVYGDPASRQQGSEIGCDAFVEKSQGWPALLDSLQKTLTDGNSRNR